EMKPFCAVCILLLLTHGMALKCNLCVSKGNGDPCTPSVQTCLSHMTACGNITFRPAPPTIRSCISMSTCWSYLLAPEVMAVCCRTDLYLSVVPYLILSGIKTKL
uniref:Si:dkeyp-80c12.8 n=1 Tax=Cyprinus carpio TaxID=7962 RepID=A0A8C1L389_CYPCA